MFRHIIIPHFHPCVTQRLYVSRLRGHDMTWAATSYKTPSRNGAKSLKRYFLSDFFLFADSLTCNQYHTLISAPQDEIFQTNLSYFPVFGCLTRLPWQCCTCMYRYGYASNKSRSLVGSFELLDGMVNVTDVSPKGSVHTHDSMLWSIIDLPVCTRPWPPYCR